MLSARARLVSRIPQAERNIRRGVEGAVKEAAEGIAAEAKRRAPVKTGALRDSIEAFRGARLKWVVGVGAEYAGAVEFGTSRQAARPYLRPSAESEQPKLAKELRGMKVL